MTVTAEPGEELIPQTSVITPTGTYFLDPGSPGAMTFPALPASLRRPGDQFQVTVAGQRRTTKAVGTSPAALAVTLPRRVTTPGFVAGVLGSAIWSFATDPAAAPLDHLILELSDSLGSSRSTVSVSRSFAAGTPSRYRVPFLTGLGNQPTTWRINRIDSIESNGLTISGTSAVEGTTQQTCGNNIVEPPETCDPYDGGTCGEFCTKL